MPTLRTEVLNWFLSITHSRASKGQLNSVLLQIFSQSESESLLKSVSLSVSLKGCSCSGQSWSVSTWHAAVERLLEPHTPPSRLLTSHQVLKTL